MKFLAFLHVNMYGSSDIQKYRALGAGIIDLEWIEDTPWNPTMDCDLGLVFIFLV